MVSNKSAPHDTLNDEPFSWEKWFRLGLRAFKKTLRRYNFGLPDAFWQHLENALNELLAALRIALHTARHRQQGVQPPARSSDAGIDIDWED